MKIFIIFQGHCRLLKNGPAMGHRSCSPSATARERESMSGGSLREFKKFRMSIDAFILHLECVFGLEFQSIS